MTSFEVSHLTCGYPNKFSIKIDDFILKKNDVLCLLGKNGSGKTTFLKTISSLLNPIQGSIFVNKKNINSYPKKNIFSLISYIDFYPIIPPFISVIEFLSLSFYLSTNIFYQLSPKQKQSIKIVAQQINITSLLQKPLSHLSQGERQRVFIASALIKNPAILLLDEPSNHLDIKQKINLMNLLKVIKKNCIIIFSSHDIDFLKSMESNYLLIKNGTSTFHSKDLSKKNILQFFD